MEYIFKLRHRKLDKIVTVIVEEKSESKAKNKLFKTFLPKLFKVESVIEGEV